MKRCPTCSRVYDNVSLRFCFDDGTELVNKVPEAGAPETAIMKGPLEGQSTLHVNPPVQIPPGIPSAPFAPPRSRVWPWLLVGGVLLLIGTTVVIAVGLRVYKHAGSPLVHHLVLQVEADEPNRDAMAKAAVAVIKNRLDGIKISGFEVKPGASGSGQVLVNLPRVENPERVKRIISSWGKLELVHIVSPGSPSPAQTFPSEEDANSYLKSHENVNGRVLLYFGPENGAKKWVIAEVPAVIDGFDVRHATAVLSPGQNDNYEIQFVLKSEGAEHFATWTASHINEYIGVVLNDEVKSIAYIRSQISDQGVITGRFTKEAAEDLALVLNSGALPVPVKFVDEKIDQ